VTQQEGPLVEPLSPEPAGDFSLHLLVLQEGQAGTTLSSVYRPPRETGSMQSRCSGLSDAPQYAHPPQTVRSAVHCSSVRSCSTPAMRRFRRRAARALLPLLTTMPAAYAVRIARWGVAVAPIGVPSEGGIRCAGTSGLDAEFAAFSGTDGPGACRTTGHTSSARAVARDGCWGGRSVGLPPIAATNDRLTIHDIKQNAREQSHQRPARRCKPLATLPPGQKSPRSSPPSTASVTPVM
jgi:hypothetical protein